MASVGDLASARLPSRTGSCPGRTTATHCPARPCLYPYGFRRLLGDRLVREQADPDLAAALDETRHGDTGGFDLPVGDPAALHAPSARNRRTPASNRARPCPLMRPRCCLRYLTFFGINMAFTLLLNSYLGLPWLPASPPGCRAVPASRPAARAAPAAAATGAAVRIGARQFSRRRLHGARRSAGAAPAEPRAGASRRTVADHGLADHGPRRSRRSRGGVAPRLGSLRRPPRRSVGRESRPCRPSTSRRSRRRWCRPSAKP